MEQHCLLYNPDRSKSKFLELGLSPDFDSTSRHGWLPRTSNLSIPWEYWGTLLYFQLFCRKAYKQVWSQTLFHLFKTPMLQSFIKIYLIVVPTFSVWIPFRRFSFTHTQAKRCAHNEYAKCSVTIYRQSMTFVLNYFECEKLPNSKCKLFAVANQMVSLFPFNNQFCSCH